MKKLILITTYVLTVTASAQSNDKLNFNSNNVLSNHLNLLNPLAKVDKAGFTSKDKYVDGKLIANGSVSASGPGSVTVDPDGKYAYVVNNTGNSILIYKIENDGKLIANGSVSASDPGSVVIHPTKKYAYVTNRNGDAVLMYQIGSDGKLIANGSMPTERSPVSIAVGTDGKYAYVAHCRTDGGDRDDIISMYQIGIDGKLTKIGTIPAGRFTFSITVHEKYAYAVNSISNDISMYKVGIDGKLADNGRARSTGFTPSSITIDRSGEYVYLPNYISSDISMYKVGIDGKLTGIGSVSTGTRPESIRVHPSGKYAYAINAGSDDISMYKITDGKLAGIGRVSSGGKYPASIAFDKTGSNAYVTNRVSDNISMYTIIPSY